MECKIFKRKLEKIFKTTKLGSLLKFKVKHFSLIITKVSISKYPSYNCICDCNGTRTDNHLVCKRTLNYLPNWPVWLNVWAIAGSSPVAVT